MLAALRRAGRRDRGRRHGRRPVRRRGRGPSDAEGLRELHALKTGRLIDASVGVVLILEGVPEPETIPYRRFAGELGVLFQIVDDILDVTGSDERLGKPHGSDERHGKLTYVSLFGLDRARELAAESHAKATAALAEAGAGNRGPDAGRRLHLHEGRMSETQESPEGRAGRREPLLEGIDGPADLHELDDEQLQQVAQEMRDYIIDTIGEIGGHFGANLGTCELAVALHSLLDSPRDKVLWDVGHQAYPHKILTGRREGLPTIRQYDGLAPFCSVFESEHDIMGAGHASTSIGYAVGLKEAMRKGIGEDGKVAAVIGDGALTGGVAYEAMHAAGGLQTPMVIVLNDNGMSISPNVGALSRYFNRVRLNPRLFHAREGVEDRLTKLPLGLGKRIERLGPEIKSAIKAYWAPGPLLRGARPRLHGGDRRPRRRTPCARRCSEAFEAERPVVVHIHTVKGKGFAPAEEGGLEGMEKWHAAKPNSIVDGEPAADGRRGRSEGNRPRRCRCRKRTRRRRSSGWRAARGRLAAAVHPGLRRRDRRRGRRDPRVVGITAAMAGGPACRSSPTRCRGSTTTSASPSRTRCCSPPGWRSRGRSRSAGSTRPSSSAPSTRSSTTSACRSSTSPSRWTGPGWSATTGRPTTAPSTSPTSGRFPTSS